VLPAGTAVRQIRGAGLGDPAGTSPRRCCTARGALHAEGSVCSYSRRGGYTFAGRKPFLPPPFGNEAAGMDAGPGSQRGAWCGCREKNTSVTKKAAGDGLRTARSGFRAGAIAGRDRPQGFHMKDGLAHGLRWRWGDVAVAVVTVWQLVEQSQGGGRTAGSSSTTKGWPQRVSRSRVDVGARRVVEVMGAWISRQPLGGDCRHGTHPPPSCGGHANGCRRSWEHPPIAPQDVSSPQRLLHTKRCKQLEGPTEASGFARVKPVHRAGASQQPSLEVYSDGEMRGVTTPLDDEMGVIVPENRGGAVRAPPGSCTAHHRTDGRALPHWTLRRYEDLPIRPSPAYRSSQRQRPPSL